MHHRDVDAGLLEHLAVLQHARDAAATLFALPAVHAELGAAGLLSLQRATKLGLDPHDE